MDPTWTPHGPHMDPTWTPHGPHMDPTWTPHGPTCIHIYLHLYAYVVWRDELEYLATDPVVRGSGPAKRHYTLRSAG